MFVSYLFISNVSSSHPCAHMPVDHRLYIRATNSLYSLYRSSAGCGCEVTECIGSECLMESYLGRHQPLQSVLLPHLCPRGWAESETRPHLPRTIPRQCQLGGGGHATEWGGVPVPGVCGDHVPWSREGGAEVPDCHCG